MKGSQTGWKIVELGMMMKFSDKALESLMLTGMTTTLEVLKVESWGQPGYGDFLSIVCGGGPQLRRLEGVGHGERTGRQRECDME